MIKQALVTTAVTAAPWWFFPNDEIMLACFTCWLLKFGYYRASGYGCWCVTLLLARRLSN